MNTYNPVNQIICYTMKTQNAKQIAKYHPFKKTKCFYVNMCIRYNCDTV